MERADLLGRFVCLSGPFAPAPELPAAGLPVAGLSAERLPESASFCSACAAAFSCDRLLSSRASLPFSEASWVLSCNIPRIKKRCDSIVRPCSKTSSGQNAVRNDEQNHQQGQQGRRSRLCLRSYALRAVDDGHKCPQVRPIRSGASQGNYCTRETICGGRLKCVLAMELVGGNGIGLHPRVQAAALNE